MLFVVIVLTFVLHAIVVHRKQRIKNRLSDKNVMIITAHPDDECMFFAPTILHFKEKHLVCFSSGNYYGHGEVRRKELYKSCSILGVPQQNISIIDNSNLQDDPNIVWDEDLLSNLILDKIQKNQIQVVITFDDYGVSGHSNHISLFKAVKKLSSQNQLPPNVEAYSLQSIPIWRKYLLLLDLPISYVEPQDLLFVSSWSGVWKAQKAMYAHWSQFVWFRILYILFSRYMVVNTLTPITS
ncbi:N-acetylglucosaminyl-phosphatidylinositol de-N-acetylase-like [Glandiceps talaboti]